MQSAPWAMCYNICTMNQLLNTSTFVCYRVKWLDSPLFQRIILSDGLAFVQIAGRLDLFFTIRSLRQTVRTIICKWSDQISVSRHHPPIYMGCCGNHVGFSNTVTRLRPPNNHAVKLVHIHLSLKCQQTVYLSVCPWPVLCCPHTALPRFCMDSVQPHWWMHLSGFDTLKSNLSGQNVRTETDL